MKKVSVSYKNSDEEVLFNEEVHYYKIPPVGRKINWHANLWIVDEIIEDWDEKKIVVTLHQYQSDHNQPKDKLLNLSVLLSKRSANGLSQHLREKHNTKTFSYLWTIEQIKAADIDALKEMPNFGVKSLKEVKQFIASL